MDQDILTMLELIRLEGIIKMLWDTSDHDELAETVHVICQNQNENIRSELERLSRQQLIEVASQHDVIITIDVVTQYYEQYRYGLKPDFTILYLIRLSKSNNKDALNYFCYAVLRDIIQSV